MSVLGSLFGRGRPDRRNIHQLIFDLAKYGNRAADLDELYRRLPEMELFARVVSADFPLQDGEQHVVQPGEVLSIQNASLPSGHTLAQFFVDRSDPRLQPVYIGMRVRDAFDMVLKSPEQDGLMLCNPADYWVALLKPELQRLLRDELREPDAAS